MTQQEINNPSMLKVGTILHGTYRIDSYLSSGGFGNTYVATNIEFEERVAIKEFFMKGVTQRDDNQTTVSVSNSENHHSFLEQKEKFKKEARRIRQLKNDHIVNVHDLFEENGTAYYVMDYVDGENLAERLKRMGKPMTEQEVRDILPQILDALKSVHDAGIWHLDLKPANIMIDKSGIVKLIDFGASKQLNAQKGGATTSTAISYTNGYAPREQMEQNYDKFGPWTDIYALGATLYNLLTNKRPPLPTDIDDDITEDKHEALPFPGNISAETKTLVLLMLNTNRLQRPQNIESISLGTIIVADPQMRPAFVEENLLIEESGNKDSTEETTIASQSFNNQLIKEKEETPSAKFSSTNTNPIPSQKHNNNSILNAIIGILVLLILGAYFFLPSNKKEVSLSSYYSNVELDNEIDSLSYSIGIAQTSGLKKYLCDNLKVDTTLMDDFCKGLIESTINLQESNIDYFHGLAIGQQLNTSLEKIDSILMSKNRNRINRDVYFYGFLNGIRNDTSHMTKNNAEQLIKDITSK
jgi:serine/threonine protein kinase